MDDRTLALANLRRAAPRAHIARIVQALTPRTLPFGREVEL